MNPSAPFIARPIATGLLTLGIVLIGAVAFALLPIAPLPQVDFPAIQINAQLPGASPDTMATSVATPLERSLGRISGITEMTSSSGLGTTNITVVFDLDRDINGAAKDVQAAINAARDLLPSNLPRNPTYRKINPADAPIMVLALTSNTMTRGQMYDIASSIIAQKISQINGIGQVTVVGSSLPAVRIELNPSALSSYDISLEQLRTTLAATNPNRPKGMLENDQYHWQIYANDQAKKAIDYQSMVVGYHNGRAVMLSDVASVIDSVQDVRNAGYSNGKPSVLLILTKQPGSNIIETTDRVYKLLPTLRQIIPQAVNMDVMVDRAPLIHATLFEMERTLGISLALVILVVFIFLRDGHATVIPSVAVPVSLIGTFAIMYLCNYSLDTISMMAVIIATGFVVDDAIVVLENISRHLEAGLSPVKAALVGAKEVGFTVFSMSLSLIAVFIPILLMSGIIGRLFREFAVTLSVAILVSLLVSLTLTPMMCSRLLVRTKPHMEKRKSLTERFFDGLYNMYATSLAWALDHSLFILMVLFATVLLNFGLLFVVSYGLFPQQDTGRIVGSVQADQSISFQLLEKKLTRFLDIIHSDPGVANAVGGTGGGQRNTANIYIMLKPLSERRATPDQIIDRLRVKLDKEPGAKLFLQSAQDLRIGGRSTNAQYQYTLQADDLDELRFWSPKILEALKHVPQLTDVNTDQQDKGIESYLTYDRDTMARLGLTPSLVDNVLNDDFGQRQISTIYNPLNQYHVVMEAAPEYTQDPQFLNNTFIVNPSITNSSVNAVIPLSDFSHLSVGSTPLAVNHQGQFAATTISFNLPAGMSLGNAAQAIEKVWNDLRVPTSVHGSFQGTALAFKQSLNSLPMLLLAAVITMYIVLGMLYESLIHPLTILSTIFSAGVGALLALKITHTDLSVIAFIGILLLIGIVKKNAIMMVDFAIEAERHENLSPREAIYKACLLRFRPIMMTTFAALFGALPLALGLGDGAEMRQPLGIAIVGGLLVSQMLTLFTTPVVYLYFDYLSAWWKDVRAQVPAHKPGAIKTAMTLLWINIVLCVLELATFNYVSNTFGIAAFVEIALVIALGCASIILVASARNWIRFIYLTIFCVSALILAPSFQSEYVLTPYLVVLAISRISILGSALWLLFSKTGDEYFKKTVFSRGAYAAS